MEGATIVICPSGCCVITDIENLIQVILPAHNILRKLKLLNCDDFTSPTRLCKEIQKLLTKTNGKTVGDVVMIPTPLVVHEHTNLEDAARVLLDTKFRCLPARVWKVVQSITSRHVTRAALAVKRDVEKALEVKGAAEARDLIKTPLGLIGTILGVKYETKQRGEPGTGTMWVQYPNGFLSPLVPDFSTSGYKGFEGYQRLSDGDHMWRDIQEFHQARQAGEEIREVIAADNDKYVAKLVAEWEKKQGGQKKEGKGKKKKNK